MVKTSTCKLFWQGTCYVMSFPMQLARALEVAEGDKLVVYTTDDGNLVVERYIEGRPYPENITYTVARIIGGGTGRNKTYKQIGFTVPRPLAEKIKKETYKFPVIEKKEGKYFKLVFKKLVAKAQALA